MAGLSRSHEDKECWNKLAERSISAFPARRVTADGCNNAVCHVTRDRVGTALYRHKSLIHLAALQQCSARV
jgi:hypothetical protein